MISGWGFSFHISIPKFAFLIFETEGLVCYINIFFGLGTSKGMHLSTMSLKVAEK